MREVGAIGLTVGDLDRELMFYTNTLPFELVSISETSGREQDALLDLSDVKMRVAMLKLGDERITLTEHLANKGRPIPADSRSFDHWFQVFWNTRLAVDDVAKLSAKLHERGVAFVSKPSSAHSQIVRDPDGHAMQLDEVSAVAAASAQR